MEICILYYFVTAVISISTITLEITYDHLYEPCCVNWTTISSNRCKRIWYIYSATRLSKLSDISDVSSGIPECSLMWFKISASEIYSLESELDLYLSWQRWHMHNWFAAFTVVEWGVKTITWNFDEASIVTNSLSLSQLSLGMIKVWSSFISTSPSISCFDKCLVMRKGLRKVELVSLGTRTFQHAWLN